MDKNSGDVSPDLPESLKGKLDKLALVKSIRICRKRGIALSAVMPELLHCINRLFSQKCYGVILSGYYEAGVIGPFTVEELLLRMLEVKDYVSFLKQVYRFDAYTRFANEVETVLAWYTPKNQNDAECSVSAQMAHRLS